MGSVGDLVGRVWHACGCTVVAGLPGEIGQLQQLQTLHVSSNQLQGKSVDVLGFD